MQRDQKDLRSQRQRLTPRKQHLLHNRADAHRIAERRPQHVQDQSRFISNKFLARQRGNGQEFPSLVSKLFTIESC